MIDRAVERYFRASYPSRGAAHARWFRAGEADRRAVIAPWLASATSILDAGCGDGELVASMLGPHANVVHLVDVAPQLVERARARLAPRVRVVHAIVGDVDTVELPRVDVVLALGVADYHPRWPALVARLRTVARQALVIDLPRAFTLRSLARRGWLAAHGVRLHVATRARARSLFSDGELYATRLHWVARLPGVAA